MIQKFSSDGGSQHKEEVRSSCGADDGACVITQQNKGRSLSKESGARNVWKYVSPARKLPSWIGNFLRHKKYTKYEMCTFWAMKNCCWKKSSMKSTYGLIWAFSPRRKVLRPRNPVWMGSQKKKQQNEMARHAIQIDGLCFKNHLHIPRERSEAPTQLGPRWRKCKCKEF